MATPDQPTAQPTPDPAQLGADQSPTLTPQDDAHDMSTVMADAGENAHGPHTSGQPPQAHGTEATQGSDFDQQRQQGAGNMGAPYGEVGRSQGMGHTADNGDEDRGYDQSGYRGGVGTSGGREDLADRQTDTNPNPFAGGYDGGGTHRPTDAQTQHLGLNSPPASRPAADSTEPEAAS